MKRLTILILMLLSVGFLILTNSILDLFIISFQKCPKLALGTFFIFYKKYDIIIIENKEKELSSNV